MHHYLHAFFARSYDRYPWLESSRDRRFILGAMVLIVLAGLFNYQARNDQWQFWQAHPHIFFVDDKPLVSTTDAGYFLSLARDYHEDTQLLEERRFYPDGTEAYKTANPPANSESKTATPMLSVMISGLGHYFFDGDLLTASNLMLPITAFLTAIAVAGLFWSIGYPAEGAIAGTGFGLSSAYFVRTSIGRIDTDQLVMFFLAICIAFMFFAAREQSFRRQIGFVMLAALATRLFEWWYPQPLFIIMLPLLAGAAIYTHHLNIKRAVAGVAVFVLITGPVAFIFGFWNFFLQLMERLFNLQISTQGSGSANNLSFPNIFSTITELDKINIIESLNLMTSSSVLGAAGAIGFFSFVIIKPKQGLIFLPFVLIGFLSVYLGNRFSFYGTPFIWFGVAWLMLSGVRYLCHRHAPREAFSRFNHGAVLISAACGVIFVAWLSLGMSFRPTIPQPSFSAPLVAHFSAIKKLDQDSGGGGIVGTWWDYGYLLHYKSGMATIHDGGTQGSPKTYLVARSFIHQDPTELVQTLKFISTNGSAGIAKNLNSQAMLFEAIDQASMPEKPLYIMVTNQMTNWLTAIAQLGLHDIAKGTPPSNLHLSGYRYHHLNCTRIEANELQCQNNLIDLARGTVNGKPVLNQVVETLNGHVKNAHQYSHQGTFVLHLSRLTSGEQQISLVPLPTWNSSFNKLYKLGLYDQSRLELVMDNYPSMRLYKILR